MRRRRAAADAAYRAPRILVPVRGRKPRQRGHEIDAVGVGHRRRQLFDFRRRADDPQPVAQPLYDRAADEDAPFEGVVDLVADLQSDGRQQVVRRGDRLLAAVHQQETSRAVRVLHRPRLDAHLPEQGRLLVARNSRDGHLVRENRGLGRSVHFARRLHRGHHRSRNVEQLQQLLVPLQGVDVEKHRARRIAHVRHMHLAARQPPDQPRIDRAEHQLALLGPFARSGDVVQNPFYLRRAEIGVDYQSRFFADEFGFAVGFQPVAVLRGPAVLPDDGVVDRLFGLRIPYDRGFALVGDAYARDVQSVDVDCGDRFGDDRRLRRPYLVRIVLDPSRFGKQLGEFALRDRPNQPFAVEYDRTGAARSLIQCQNVLFHMLVFLCCFLRPARGCRPLRLQIYQKNPGFETKPRSFFSKPIPRKKPTAGPGKAAAQADRLPFPCLHAVGLKPDLVGNLQSPPEMQKPCVSSIHKVFARLPSFAGLYERETGVEPATLSLGS